ncbi:SCO-spondin-like isoform X1 [Pelodiscus sinensis]|uniref:SCO-spondin-like isoform X1 n=1 Tax=Pelodiscus sinensis TaxID=13735 RepID=UPI003F6B0454
MPGAARSRALGPPARLLLGPLVWLLWAPAALAEGRWCERTERVTEQAELSPRREQAVPCAELPRYQLAGWHLDPHRTRQAGAPASLCHVYKPPDTRPLVWNRTVRACCQGWSGPHCTQGEALLGLCFSTWQCQAGPGAWNRSPAEHGRVLRSAPWGRGWKNGSSAPCLRCALPPLPGDLPAPFLLRPSPPTALLGLPRPRPRLSATCATWAGSALPQLRRTHFRFPGACTYRLAADAEGTWAVHISGPGACAPPGPCPRALRMLFGPDLVEARGRNISVNGAVVPVGEPLLQAGISVRWLGDFVLVESGLGVRVKADGRGTAYVTVSRELRGHHPRALRALQRRPC